MTSAHAADPAARTDPSQAPQAPQPAATSATGSGSGTGSRLAWLDVMRGLAALAVVFNHFGYFLPPAVKNPVYQWINPGDYGVSNFFLITEHISPCLLERKGRLPT